MDEEREGEWEGGGVEERKTGSKALFGQQTVKNFHNRKSNIYLDFQNVCDAKVNCNSTRTQTP